jgi:hypothetical protein
LVPVGHRAQQNGGSVTELFHLGVLFHNDLNIPYPATGVKHTVPTLLPLMGKGKESTRKTEDA